MPGDPGAGLFSVCVWLFFFILLFLLLFKKNMLQT